MLFDNWVSKQVKLLTSRWRRESIVLRLAHGKRSLECKDKTGISCQPKGGDASSR